MVRRLERQLGETVGFRAVERHHVDGAERADLNDAAVLAVDLDDLADLRFAHFWLLVKFRVVRVRNDGHPWLCY